MSWGRQGHEGVSAVEWMRRFLVVFLPAVVILTIAAGAHYYSLQQGERVKRETSELLNVGLARSALNRDLADVVRDLLFLAGYLERQGFGPGGRLRKAAVEALLLSFVGEKRLYDQVRFLDLAGREQVRVNYVDGAPVPVPEKALQDKSKRYYVTRALRLGQGEVYISPLDLNIENGVLERPFKPVMRFTVAVYDAGGTRRGILVLNYLGRRLLANFSSAAANIADHVHLLNSGGYWFRAPDTSQEWGFMLAHGARFADRYPEAWRRIRQGVSGQFRTPRGLFTFETVTPLSVAAQVLGQAVVDRDSSHRWKVVAVLPPHLDVSTSVSFLRENGALYGLMLIIVTFGSGLLTRANVRHHLAQMQGDYERRFRHTLEDMELAAVSVDRDRHIVFCNDYFLRLTGWDREEVIGQPCAGRFFAAGEEDWLWQALGRLQAGEPFVRDVEARVRRRDGGECLIAWHNTPSFGADGGVVGLTCIGEDVTTRKAAEEEVRRLSRAVEQSPSMVMLTNREGRIEYVNPKFTEVTGYTPAEVLGKNPRILKSGETSPEEYRTLWQTVLSGEVWRGEFHNRRKNGELYWEAASISAVRGPDGEISDFVAVKEDITERKRLEREVEARNRELARNQALAAMGRMASMVAHDLRNPLSSVKMGMQILGRQVPKAQREIAQIALDQIRYMENILSDMLAYARPEAVKSEWVSIEKLLDTTLGGLQGRIGEAQAKVAVRYQPGLPPLAADADKLRQLFSNLIVNALQAMDRTAPESRRIYIAATQLLGDTGTAIRVEICDSGRGLEASERERLFEPFYTTRSKGTGLGLAIVRQIAEQHGGRVALEPRPGGGACAVVVLPTRPRDATAAGAAAG